VSVTYRNALGRNAARQDILAGRFARSNGYKAFGDSTRPASPLHVGTPEVRTWCRRNNVHLIWTPTNASWLNPIECQFTPVKEFVIRNTYYDNRDELRKALNRYAAYRNAYAKRKR